MAFSTIDFQKEIVDHIFFFLQEEDMAVVEATCKTFWKYVENDPCWDASLKEKVIFPVQSPAKGQLANLYRQYCQYFKEQFPLSSKENHVFTRKANMDSLIRGVSVEQLRSIFEAAAKSHPQLLPLLVHVSPCPENWKCFFSLNLVLEHMPSHAAFYIHPTKRPHEFALRAAVQYAPHYVTPLLEKGALPSRATLDCAVKHASDLVPLFLARGANPNDTTLHNTARFCPEHIPLIVQRLHKLNTSQYTMDMAIVTGGEMRRIDLRT